MERTPIDLGRVTAAARSAWTGARAGGRWTAREYARHPYLYSFIVVAHVCAALMIFVDAPLARHLKQAFPPSVTSFFSTWGGALGKPEAYLTIAAVVIALSHGAGYFAIDAALRARLKRFQDAALFIMASILSAGMVVNIVKPILGRVRPRGLFDTGDYGLHMFSFRWAMNSFPSGHSQMAFSLAVALCLVYPRYDLLYLLLAAVIASSRFLGSVHYLSDVVMGSYIGIVVPLLLKRHFYDRRGIDIRLHFDRDRGLATPVAPTPPLLPAPDETAEALDPSRRRKV